MIRLDQFMYYNQLFWELNILQSELVSQMNCAARNNGSPGCNCLLTVLFSFVVASNVIACISVGGVGS